MNIIEGLIIQIKSRYKMERNNQNEHPDFITGALTMWVLLSLWFILSQVLSGCNTVKRSSHRSKSDSTSVSAVSTVTVIKRDTVNNTIHEIEYVFQTDTVRVFDTVYLPGIGKVIAPRLKSARVLNVANVSGSASDSVVTQRKDSTQIKAVVKHVDKESKRPHWFGLVMIVVLILSIVLYIGERKLK